MAGSETMKSGGETDARIAAAFTEAATSDDVGRVLVEVEAAANAAGTAADEARTRALDPLVARDDVTLARREMDDASFTRDRLTEAARRLGERLNELRALEKARAQRAEHERVSAERNRLAVELERVAKSIAEIAGLVAQIDACDREIRKLNATTGLALGHIRPVLAGAAPVIGTLLADAVARDAFIAVAALRSSPVVSGGAGARELRVKRSATSPAAL
jgi:hypothetical protein